MRPTEQHRRADARALAIDRLRHMGVDAPMPSNMTDAALFEIMARVGFRRGDGESTINAMLRFGRGKRKASATVATPRVINRLATDKYVMEPPANPRAAYMESLPRPISMPWDGTGVSW